MSLTGIIPPLVTPLKGADTLDVAGLEHLIEHVLAGGVQGVFLLGTTGEGPCLSHARRHELVARAAKLVAGRVPVLVCITDTAFTESLELADAAYDAGATAVVAAPPFYFPEGQQELLEYLEHLTARLPLPLFLYNMPSLTKVAYEPETVAKALDMPGIVGLKDSSGNLTYFQRIHAIIARRTDWSLLMGPEELLLESLRGGGHGGVAGGANVFPRLFVELYSAAASGDWARAEQCQARLKLLGQVYQVGRYGSSIIKGIKCALSLMDICDDFMAEPFRRFRAPERERIKHILKQSIEI